MDTARKQVVLEKLTSGESIRADNKWNIDSSVLPAVVDRVERSISKSQRSKKHIKIFEME